MKKLILFVLCALSGLMVSAQSRWGITPEGGFAAVNRVGMGSSWRAGVKVGVGVSYQFEPGWIGLKSGLYYANRGYSLGDYPRTTESATYVLKEMMTGGITQHFLQLPVMADFSWKVSKEVRMHLAVCMPVYLSRMIRIGDLRLRWGIRRSRRRLVNMSNLLA